MFKYIIAVIVVILSNMNVFSQMSANVKKLTISYLKKEKSSENIDLDTEKGPHLNYLLYLKNVSKSDLILKPQKSRFHLNFTYEGQVFNFELIDMAFSSNQSLTLKPNQVSKVYLGIYPFVGTPLFNKKNKDYLISLIKILPTIRLVYKQPDIDLNIGFSDINEVEISE